MTLSEILHHLEAVGTAQNRKVYAKHGVTTPMYGVSYGELGKLQKQLKTNHQLAMDLWATGNHDARILATMIADAKTADPALLDQWVGDLTNYVLTDAFSKFAATTRHARACIEAWTASTAEWISTAGWNILSHIALKDKTLADDYFTPFLSQIETGIHQQPNRTRYAMNSALIAIGLRNEALEKQAITIAKTIGTIEVDHGETDCETPSVIDYITKTKARRKK